MPASSQHYPVKLTQAQRKVVAEIVPELADRLKLHEKDQRTIPFSPAELKNLQQKATVGLKYASTGMMRNSLRHITDFVAQALDRSQGIEAIPVAERLYQFKITLKETTPPIWRRIQVRDGTLDKLHEHIQTAMGWTNSHLHRFKIAGIEYGDPELLDNGFDEWNFEDSINTKFREVLPKTGKRFLFGYEYDFGDCWEHEVLFECCVRAERGGRYPVCVEGDRSCPPEDVGGVRGYLGFLDAIADPDDERHDELVQWIGGRFDPESFDPAKATKKMRRGLPDWRRMV